MTPRASPRKAAQSLADLRNMGFALEPEATQRGSGLVRRRMLNQPKPANPAESDTRDLGKRAATRAAAKASLKTGRYDLRSPASGNDHHRPQWLEFASRGQQHSWTATSMITSSGARTRRGPVPRGSPKIPIEHCETGPGG